VCCPYSILHFKGRERGWGGRVEENENGGQGEGMKDEKRRKWGLPKD